MTLGYKEPRESLFKCQCGEVGRTLCAESSRSHRPRSRPSREEGSEELDQSMLRERVLVISLARTVLSAHDKPSYQKLWAKEMQFPL